MLETQITLAAPWYPRGELTRVKRLLPQLQSLYGDIVIALRERSPETPEVSKWFDDNGVRYQLFEGWSGRHVCVGMAVERDATFIHYCDFDRILRWIECHPAELSETIRRIPEQDLLVMGRTEFAWETHPRSMFETESLFNTVFSHYFDRTIDFGAGSRGLSQSAAEFVLEHTTHSEALIMDSAWSVLLKRGGFTWGYVEVDGLEWESADQHKDAAATREEQQDLADRSDASAKNWQLRTQVARKILNFGLQAITQPLEAKE
ncbi:MAG: hypothetical protein RLP44_14060 [Aggregatilineales bacterium]